MGKQKQPIVIIGEGPTEFYYFNSLKDRFRGLQIEPTIPKHSNLKELEAKIAECIAKGYAKIYCVVDMDNKVEGSEREQYLRLKSRYAQPISKPKRGIYCEVKFFETHRCTELFFLYYFAYTSKPYASQELLLRELQDYCHYEKRLEFFRKCKGLHSYFEKMQGNLDNAISHANRSCLAVEVGERQYTYSQLGEMIETIMEERRESGK